MKKNLMALFILALVFVMTICSSRSFAAPFPTRPIELVSGYAPGSAQDTFVRMIHKAIIDNNLTNAVVNIVNKEGGSTATSLAYVNAHKGDGHYLLAGGVNFLTTPMLSDLGFDYNDFTHIAMMANDPVMICARADSGLKLLDDLRERELLSCGGAGIGNVLYVSAKNLGEKLGKEINYIPFQGTNDTIIALLGGDIDLGSINVSMAAEYIADGQFVCLAVLTEERLKVFADIPTAIEQGYDLSFSTFRGIAAPKDIPQEAIDFYVDLLTRVNESKTWQEEYLDLYNLAPTFLVGQECKDAYDYYYEVLRKSLVDVGLIKQ